MRSNIALLGVTSIAVVLLAGCQYGMRRDVLRQQAAADLGCPAGDVTVTHGSEGYRASGCGQDAQYDCPDGPEDMTEYGDRSCTIVRRTVGLEETETTDGTATDDTATEEAAGEATADTGDTDPGEDAEGADVADEAAEGEVAAEDAEDAGVGDEDGDDDASEDDASEDDASEGDASEGDASDDDASDE